MSHTRALLITTLTLLLTAGSASAAVLNWEGTSTSQMGDFATGVMTGGGVATVNGSNGVVPAHLRTLRLAASRGNIAG